MAAWIPYTCSPESAVLTVGLGSSSGCWCRHYFFWPLNVNLAIPDVSVQGRRANSRFPASRAGGLSLWRFLLFPGRGFLFHPVPGRGGAGGKAGSRDAARAGPFVFAGCSLFPWFPRVITPPMSNMWGKHRKYTDKQGQGDNLWGH